MKHFYILVLIVLLGSILRLVGLDIAPPSLNWDEVSHGYNAYSILKTGKDEWGVSFPTIFRAYGDYKLPVYIYTTAGSEFIFGLNDFAVRFPSILAGLATIILTYLLSKKLFGWQVGVLASLLVSVEPWTLFLSRSALESNFSMPLVVAGVYFFVSSLEKPRFLLLSTLFFGLSVWTYNSARIFVPLLLILLILVYKDKIWLLWKNHKKNTTHYLLLTTFFFIPMFWQLAHPIGQARYEKVAILNEGAINEINEARMYSTLSPIVARLVHNRPAYLAQHFIKNWVSHFSPGFLFFKGGTQFNYSVPGHGLLYPVNLLFFTIGILYLIKVRTKASAFVLIWLILAPIPSSLTREAPHVLRSVTMLPIPMILTALGGWTAWNWWNKQNLLLWNKEISNISKFIPLLFYIAILSVSIENYLREYFGNYRRNYSWSWQYGYKQAVEYTKDYYNGYDKFIMTKKYGEPHESFLFYWPWEPEKYRNDPNLIRFEQSGWYWVDRFDKFYFVNDWEIPHGQNEDFVLESGGNVKCQMLNVKCLLITSPGNYPPGWTLLKTVSFLDGKPGFDILEKR